MAQCILGYVGREGSTWCSLQIREMQAAVAGVFELGQSGHADCELIRRQTPPSKDAAWELGRSESVSQQECVVWKHMDVVVMLLGRCESVTAGAQTRCFTATSCQPLHNKVHQVHHSEPNWLLQIKIPRLSEQ